MNTLPLGRAPLAEAFAALRRDLVSPAGPAISTMRNYRFAIVQYDPRLEFEAREQAQQLAGELIAHGWMVLSLDLQRLLIERVRAAGPDFAARVAQLEAQLAKSHPERALNYLTTKLRPLIEGPAGLAADCSRVISAYVAEEPDRAERTLALVGRAGALYPFFRVSALLRHLDGHTQNVPVVLLYPGARRGPTGLSFMGQFEADNDYRPRIYAASAPT